MLAQFNLFFARFNWCWCSWIYFYAFRFICMWGSIHLCTVRFIFVPVRFDFCVVRFIFGPFDLFLHGSILSLLFWCFEADFRFICVCFILFILDLKILSVTECHRNLYTPTIKKCLILAGCNSQAWPVTRVLGTWSLVNSLEKTKADHRGNNNYFLLQQWGSKSSNHKQP